MHKLVVTELLVLLLLAKQTSGMDPESVDFGPSYFDQFCNWTFRPESGVQKDRSFIIHGLAVEPGSYPYVAKLDVSTNASKRTRPCAASILDNRHLLTAASCVVSPQRIRASNSSDFVNVVSVNNIMLGQRRGWSERDVVYTSAEAVFVVANYDVVGRDFVDIAVIRTKTTIAFNDFIKPVCLASASDTLPKTCVALGYGFNNTYSFQQAPIISPFYTTQCKQGTLRAQIEKSIYDDLPPKMDETRKQQFASALVDVMLTRGKMCNLLSGDNSPIICQGDDGGPLMCRPMGTSSSGEYKSSLKQFAINSYAGSDDKCKGGKSMFNYFTSVKYYKVWLEYVALPNLKNVIVAQGIEKQRVSDCAAKNDWTRISWQTPSASQTQLSTIEKLHICRKLHAYLTCVENSPKASYCDHMDSTLALIDIDNYSVLIADLLPMFQDESCKQLQVCRASGTNAVAGLLSARPPVLLLVAVSVWNGWHFLQRQHLL